MVGQSRFGGTPDLPPSVLWPTRDGVSMLFLAQINLAELEAGYVDFLPEHGWLWFFYFPEAVYQGERGEKHQILFFDGPRELLRPTSLPDNLMVIDDDLSFLSPVNHFRPHVPAFRPDFSVSFESPVWQTVPDHGRHSLFQERTQIGGFSPTFNGDPVWLAYHHYADHPAPPLEMDISRLSAAYFDEYADYLVARGSRPEDLQMNEQARRDYHDLLDYLATYSEAIAKWRPLLILDSYRDMNMVWGDSGLLQFIANEDDCRARRFDRSFCHLNTT